MSAIKFHTLTDTEVHSVLLNALYSAEHTYQTCADNARDMVRDGTLRDAGLEEQFRLQAKDARAMAERIEGAVSVVLSEEG